MHEVVDLTRELVRIPSHADETVAGDRIEEWLRRATDAAVTRDPTGNVLARRGDGPRSLALVGHHDVVPPDETQVAAGGRPDDADGGDEYFVEERDGRLHGRGTADMKGAVAAMLLSFRDANIPDDTELHFASFVGEEQGGDGCRAYLDRTDAHERFDHAVVGEGSTNYSGEGVTDVVVAHKGRRGSTVVAQGAAAHASEPGAGDNAIYRAGDAIEEIRDLPFPEAEVFGERVEGSVVVTEIEGGSAWNVVPERCEVTVDERTVPGERVDLGRVETIEGVSWRVDQDLPPMACDDRDFAAGVRDAAGEAQERSPALVTKPHATDAGWLAEAGVTCVVCGPAEPGEAHTATESVGIDVLERCERIYRAVAESF